MPLSNDAAEPAPTDEPVADDVRRLVQRASAARQRGHPLVADDLLRETQALAAALAQHAAALDDARRRVNDLAHEVHTFRTRVADDRALHELADDAGVLLALYDDLARARERLITLEMTRP